MEGKEEGKVFVSIEVNSAVSRNVEKEKTGRNIK